jgi:P-type conjugative transfer protein TrbJ
MTHKLLCAFLLSAAIVAAPVTPATALTVFDPTNYSQNLLTAVRSLEQIQNQIQQLQNEAQMLVNMARNLESLDFAIIHELNDTISGDRRAGPAGARPRFRNRLGRAGLRRTVSRSL